MTYTRSLEDFTPPKRFDNEPFTSVRMQEAEGSGGPWTTLETITIDPVDADPSAPATRSYTTGLATLEEGWLRLEWVDDDGAIFDSDPVRFPTPGSRLASAADVATRLATDLSERQEDQIDVLLDAATALILEAAGKDDAWLADQDPVPQVLRWVCVEVVCRGMVNAQGLASESKTLGQFSYQRSYGNGAAGRSSLLLSQTDRLLIKRAVWGTNTATARTEEAVFEDIEPGLPTTVWYPYDTADYLP
jgi:hypothetical protein